jgi:hypothetical protein
MKNISTKGLVIFIFSQVLGVNKKCLIHSSRPCNMISESWKVITSRESVLSDLELEFCWKGWPFGNISDE